jgi:hypothetical protein
VSLLDRARAAPPGHAEAGAAARFGFDHVEVPGEAGATDRLSQREFEALPLQQRVGLLVQGRLRFYRDGRQVAASEAMKSAY